MDVNTENEVKISGETESPSKEVSRKRKTKVEIMETDTAAKKPNFPPVAIEEGVKNIFHKINLKNCFGWVSFFSFFFHYTKQKFLKFWWFKKFTCFFILFLFKKQVLKKSFMTLQSGISA